MPPRHKLYLLPPLSLIPKPLAELVVVVVVVVVVIVVVVVVVVVVLLFQLQPARLLLG